MTDEREIKIGDEVKIKGEDGWYKVQDVTREEVKTIHKGTLFFTRIYFGTDDHRPVWDYEVEAVRDANDDS